ncbi:MAG: hypothetical protein V1799_07720 [bacterium]
MVILFPELHPPNLGFALSARFRDSDWTFQQIRPPFDESDPLKFLCESYLEKDLHYKIVSASDILSQESFQGKIIWIEFNDFHTWEKWAGFLSLFQQACKATSLMRRSMICACVIGESANVIPEKDACLDVFKWNDCVNSLDMLIYVHMKVESTFPSDVHRSIATNIIDSIAMWDPNLADYLASRAIGEILNPRSLLEQYAKERNWLPGNAVYSDNNWSKGKTYLWQGKDVCHSAVFALQGPIEELERRIWSAQVGVLFPFIEECRRRMIIGNKLGIMMPFQTEEGKLTSDIRDMEIGQITYALQRSKTYVDRELKKLVFVLREMRNDLAHLENVKTSDLLSKEILEYDRILDK